MPQDSPTQGRLLDLAEELLPLLEANLSLPMSEQIAAWQTYYEHRAPCLLPRLYADYERMDGGWLEVARERIFPTFPSLINVMNSALRNIHTVCGDLCERAAARLHLAQPPVVVAYVGLGNGAGWATKWHDEPAVLLGLENIADLGWQ